MLIQELVHLESISNSSAVHGSTGRRPLRGFDQAHNLYTNFYTTNYFQTVIKAPHDVFNYSAAAGAKADAVVGPYYTSGSYTKADTLSFVDFLGNSTSYSASAALITPYSYY